MILVALLLYKKVFRDLEKIGSEFNSYDPCVYNRIILGKQHPVIFHEDDAMSSHVNPKVNDKFKLCMNRNYGKHNEVKTNRGKVNIYLGMTFYLTEKPNVKITMKDYVKNIINVSQ